MRPTVFHSDVLRQHLRQAKMATLDELKRALGTQVALTVFRKLKQLDYLASYSHRARYYTLRQIARFDTDGLWSHEAVWFSRPGTLLATAEAWVQHSPKAILPKNWPSAYMSKCRTRSITWPNSAGSLANSSPAFISIAPATRSSAADNSWHVVVSRRSPPWWMRPDWRFLPRS